MSNVLPLSLITDFSDVIPDAVSMGDFRFGSTGRASGGTTRFSTGVPKGTLSVSGGALTFTGGVPTPSNDNPPPINGFAIYLDGPACVNASAHTGVSFTLSVGGSCAVYFGFHDADHQLSTIDNDRGLCSGNCYGAKYSITRIATPTNVRIPFNAAPLSPASPATPSVNAARLIGMQWELGITGMFPCSGTVTIDDIKLY